MNGCNETDECRADYGNDTSLDQSFSPVQNLGNTSEPTSDSNDLASDTSASRREGQNKKKFYKRHKGKHKPWYKNASAKRRKLESLNGPDEPPRNENQLNWLVDGSPYVGKRVRRSVLGEDGDEIGYAKGNIVGWLPAEKSDFNCPKTGEPAPLWHLVYDEVCENDIRCCKPLAPLQDTGRRALNPPEHGGSRNAVCAAARIPALGAWRRAARPPEHRRERDSAGPARWRAEAGSLRSDCEPRVRTHGSEPAPPCGTTAAAAANSATSRDDIGGRTATNPCFRS